MLSDNEETVVQFTLGKALHDQHYIEEKEDILGNKMLEDVDSKQFHMRSKKLALLGPWGLKLLYHLLTGIFKGPPAPMSVLV